MKISSATRRDNGKMVYLVQSEKDCNHWHIVWREPDGFHCSCSSFKYGRKGHCKHTNAVKMEIWMAMDEIGAKWMPPMKVERQRLEAVQRKAEYDKHFGPGSSKSVEQLMEIEREYARVKAPVAIHSNFQKKLDATIFPAAERAVLQSNSTEFSGVFACKRS